MTQDQQLYSGAKDKATELRISVDFTTDLARSFSLCASTFSFGSLSSYSGKKQKCQNTSKEVIQVAFSGLARNISVWKFHVLTQINFQLVLVVAWLFRF